MEIAQIAARLELPEERVAQMVQLVRTNGMPESQMGAMMRMATSKGLTPDEIAETMTTFGIPAQKIVRVMSTEGILDDKAAAAMERKLTKLAGGVEQSAQATAPNKSVPLKERYDWAEVLKKTGVIVFWLLMWELLDRIVDNRLLLAGPIRTLQALFEQLVKPNFWAICGATFGRIALGFLLALGIGFALALICYKSKGVRRFVDPIISLLKTIPMASFVILLLIWVGTQALTVYLAFLIVVPIIYTNVLTGFESASTQMLEMARVFNLSKWRTFMYIYRPAFMPFLYSSSKLSLGMSWKAGVMAEVLAVPALSIGKEMYTARTFLDTPGLLAWTVVVMLLSMLFEKIVLWALRKAQLPAGSRLGSSAKSGSSVSGKTQQGEHLVVSQLSKAFGNNQVLHNCNFSLAPGQIGCLMAPSGSGKTTLFRVLLKLEQADAGNVRGVEKGRVSMMFQEDRLCETLTPIDNVALVMPAQTQRAKIRALLAEVLPATCLDQPVMELSGGMRRRVSLVRALAHPSGLVILDEPFTGLDNELRKKVISFILRHQAGRTFLIATHGEGDAELLGAQRMNLAEINGGVR